MKKQEEQERTRESGPSKSKQDAKKHENRALRRQAKHAPEDAPKKPARRGYSN